MAAWRLDALVVGGSVQFGSRNALTTLSLALFSLKALEIWGQMWPPVVIKSRGTAGLNDM